MVTDCRFHGNRLLYFFTIHFIFVVRFLLEIITLLIYGLLNFVFFSCMFVVDLLNESS